MQEHSNPAGGTGSGTDPPGLRAPGSRRRRALAVVAGVLVCGVVVAALLLLRSSWWAGPAPHEGAGLRPKEGAPADAASPAPSAWPDASQQTVEALKDESLAVIRQLMREFPDDPGAMCLMANVHARFGVAAQAEEWYQRSLAQDPRQANAYHGLAMLTNQKGDYGKAVELWRKAQEINPDLPGIGAAVAEALLKMGQLQEAIAALQKEVQCRPGQSACHYLLGRAYLQQKEYAKAAGNYQKAIELEPNDPRPYYGLASAFARLGQPDRAREYMEKFQARKADEERMNAELKRTAQHWLVGGDILAETHADAAAFYVTHQRLRDAEAHLRRGASVDSKSIRCRQALAELYCLGGRLEEALAICRQLRQIDPSNASYHLYVGDLLFRLQRFEVAEEAVRRAIELAPSRPAGYRTLVRLLLARHQKLPEAQALARKLVELAPTAMNYSILGDACCANGDVAGAREALRQALDLEDANGKTGGPPNQPEPKHGGAGGAQ